MKHAQEKKWFKAKRYGYGWGLPQTPIAWAVFVVLLTLGVAPLVYASEIYPGDTFCQKVLRDGVQTVCDPEGARGLYIAAALMWMTAVVLLLAYISTQKGEKPAWRWGGKRHGSKKS